MCPVVSRPEPHFWLKLAFTSLGSVCDHRAMNYP